MYITIDLTPNEREIIELIRRLRKAKDSAKSHLRFEIDELLDAEEENS
jgi:hypothetical protein